MPGCSLGCADRCVSCGFISPLAPMIDAMVAAGEHAGLTQEQSAEITRNVMVGWREIIAAAIEHRQEHFGLQCEVELLADAMAAAPSLAIDGLSKQRAAALRTLMVKP